MKFTSPIISAASGSSAGNTFSHNNGGLYIRARATPTNPNSTKQQAQRAALGAANAGWAALTDAQRTLWNDYAAATSWTDKLGQSITVTGHQAYVRWASVRSRLGESIAVAPAGGTSGFGEPPTGITAESTTPAINVAVSGGASDDGDVFVQLSSALSAGQSSVKRALSFDSEAAIADAATTVALTPVATLVLSSRRVMRARIAYDDGRLSQAFETVVTIAAS